MTDTPKTVPPEVIEALKRGDKKGAMKMLLAGRQVTSIADVMKLLQSLQESGVVKEVKQQVNVNFTSRAAALPAGVIDALRNGNKIEAIRLLREATGAGLAEAKGTIDSFEASHAPRSAHPTHAPSAADTGMRTAVPQPMPIQVSPQQPGLSPGEVPRTNAKTIGFVVILVVAVIAVWFALR